MSRILRVSSRTLTSSEVQPSPTWWPTKGTTLSASGAGNDDSPSSCSMRRRTSPGRVPSSRLPCTTSSSSWSRLDAGATQAGRRLEGRDDEAGELPRAVQHGEGVDHRHHRGAGVGDDAAGPVGDLARVDLRHDERHVGLGAEDGAVVDGDDPARGRQLDPLAGDAPAGCRRSRRRCRRRTPASAPRRRRPRPATRNVEPTSSAPAARRTPAPVAVAGRQHVEHDPADGAGDADDAERSVARPPCRPSPVGSHVSGRCPRRRRPHPRWSPARTPCAPPAPPRRAGRRG